MKVLVGAFNQEKALVVEKFSRTFGSSSITDEATDLTQRMMTRLLAVTAMSPMMRYSSSITPRITLEGGG